MPKEGFVKGRVVGTDAKKELSGEMERSMDRFYKDISFVKRNGASEQETTAIMKSVKDFLAEAVNPYVAEASVKKTSQNAVWSEGKGAVTDAEGRRSRDRCADGSTDARKTYKARNTGHDQAEGKERAEVQATTMVKEEPGADLNKRKEVKRDRWNRK
jgi:hypothetical protein